MSNSLNLQEIDQEQALNLSKFFIKSKQNIALFGRRGTGKSEIALQAAEDCGMKVNYINLSVIERADLAGYPNVMDSSDTISFKSPVFLPALLSNEPDSIILFDEIDKASPEVTAPLLEILQFRTINNKKINAAACILTGNLPEENTYSNVISSALLDRTAKYILQFNFDKWIDWAKINSVHDLILGFLRSDPEFAIGKLNDNTYASPSPRGWTLSSKALIQAKELKMSEVESVSQIICGYVGADAGMHFKIWYENYKKFEPYIASLIETGETSINFQKLMPTEKLIFVISACYAAKQKIISKKQNKFIYLEYLCNFLVNNRVEQEIQIMGFYNSFDVSLITKYKLYTCQVFFDHFKKLNENVTFKK